METLHNIKGTKVGGIVKKVEMLAQYNVLHGIDLSYAPWQLGKYNDIIPLRAVCIKGHWYVGAGIALTLTPPSCMHAYASNNVMRVWA